MRFVGSYVDLVMVTRCVRRLSVFRDHLTPYHRHRPTVLHDVTFDTNGLSCETSISG